MNRFLWFVIVPTTCSICPWIFLLTMQHDPVTNRVSITSLWIDSGAPMLGAMVALGYGSATIGVRRMWPLLPFVLVAAGYLTTGLVVVVNYDQYDTLEGTTKWFGIVQMVQFLTFVIQPFLAVLGGLACTGQPREG